jgi:hypothetical protein
MENLTDDRKESTAATDGWQDESEWMSEMLNETTPAVSQPVEQKNGWDADEWQSLEEKVEQRKKPAATTASTSGTTATTTSHSTSKNSTATTSGEKSSSRRKPMRLGAQKLT